MYICTVGIDSNGNFWTKFCLKIEIYYQINDLYPVINLKIYRNKDIQNIYNFMKSCHFSYYSFKTPKNIFLRILTKQLKLR